MKHQRGYIWRASKSWYGRWYQNELHTGADGAHVVVRRQHAEKLCEYGDRYRSKKNVQPLLDKKLAPLNEGRAAPESTLSVAEYAEKFFLPYAERELKPSTASGYRVKWRTYLKPALGTLVVRDARCVDITNVLTAIHRDHGVGRRTLRHCKAILSSLFRFAKRAGVIDGQNPVRDAGIPRSAHASAPTYAYTAEEVLKMLNALDGVAKAAIALMYFCGLRPGEARAARWADYDPDKGTLRVRASLWRTHLTAPKTEESAAMVPVAEILADILSETPRISEFVLSGPCRKPIDLHNLAARVVVPALKRCAECHEPKTEHGTNGHEFQPLPQWRGFYALRRGLATLATSVESPLAAKSLLRHSNVQTTAAYYIKSVPAEAVRAVEKIDALFGAGDRANVQ